MQSCWSPLLLITLSSSWTVSCFTHRATEQLPAPTRRTPPHAQSFTHWLSYKQQHTVLRSREHILLIRKWKFRNASTLCIISWCNKRTISCLRWTVGIYIIMQESNCERDRIYLLWLTSEPPTYRPDYHGDKPAVSTPKLFPFKVASCCVTLLSLPSDSHDATPWHDTDRRLWTVRSERFSNSYSSGPLEHIMSWDRIHPAHCSINRQVY